MSEPEYIKAHEIRLHNRRIRVARSTDKEQWMLQFKSLNENREVEIDGMLLSDEACFALVNTILEIAEEDED